MGKAQKKTGKGRLDKYYKLAKEQGYRARSAFKLIQLNKKYAFLESARCCIDLCAAPGGWLQVASKYMPVNSMIVGVDLVPIKPIPRVATFATDITTPQCRNLIRGELKDWKADVVLHDGAPNVGSAWIQDAYSQSELVLMSLKLAVEFLVKGGTFVTKVFRSADYNNLIWVFTQLFSKVEATKPPSSRNVSAEIFVVCREFKAPKHIDPKFLDPRHVFKELSASVAAGGDKGTSTNNVQENVFQPEKKRRKRDGYEDGDYTLFKSVGAEHFVKSTEPIAVLGSVNRITFDNETEKEWLSMEQTTADVRANCQDLKVLGKGDFKALLKWRLALREELGLDVKTTHVDESTEVVEVIEVADEDAEIGEELERLNAEAMARARRERRRANEAKRKTVQRMQLQMTAPLDIGVEQSDAALGMGQDMFDLDTAQSAVTRKGRRKLENGEPDGSETEDSGEEQPEDDEPDETLDAEEQRENRLVNLETEMDGMYEAYRQTVSERDAKFRAKQERMKNKDREGDWGGIRAAKPDDDSSDDDEEGEGGWENMTLAKANDEDISDEDSDGGSDDLVPTGHRRQAEVTDMGPPGKRRKLVDAAHAKPPDAVQNISSATQMWFRQDVFASVEGLEDASEDDEPEELSEPITPAEAEGSDRMMSVDRDEVEIVPQDADDIEMWDVDDQDPDEMKRDQIKKHGLLTAEAMTLAQQLVNREKTKAQLMDDGFTRYSLNSKDDLPSWFLDDEAAHYKVNIPITKEAVAAIRAKQRALDARPIKKVAEAKGRKKLRAAQRLEKAMKKVQGVNDASDMTEREKAQQIEKLMRKGAASGKKKKEVKVVVAKGSHKGIKGRPKGVKGRYTMVDARMRKETRAKKRKEKAKRR